MRQPSLFGQKHDNTVEPELSYNWCFAVAAKLVDGEIFKRERERERVTCEVD
jgi:hypothetical protein